MNPPAFDAVLLLGFGGPESPADIRPFLAHVLKGRPVPPSRLEEVAHHYEQIGGRSPFNDWTRRQCAALKECLDALDLPLGLHIAMWHAAPFCEDVVRDLARGGARKLLVVIMAAFYDQSTVQRYTAVVEEAAAKAAADGAGPIEIQYTRSPEHWDGFYRAAASQVRAAASQLPAALRSEAKVLFTAHSVPTEVGHSSGYVASFERAAARISDELGITHTRCVYQSRSGSPRDPWLEPDVCSALEEEAAQGTKAVLLAPIGFVCDHVEVLFDLDVEAAALAQKLGLPLVRAQTVGTHPEYITALASAVRERCAPRHSRPA
ncbi:MAG: ferrochelatase [Polyangiales bacterium]